ncbi:Eco57I restriction-modification methylase domain-containing protein [Halarcobacter sp.]|uniref:Eco57I restriction-modification methylase domain-containing protein n=1 Tax=Halarcobacter sp. TaxID=2321133 RepID=UPI002AABDA6C|nr:DNA methyltransferase [Halarcobacter sp.]
MSKKVSLKDFLNDINKNNLYTLETVDNSLPQRLLKSLKEEIKPNKILVIDGKPLILFFKKNSDDDKTIFKKCWNFAEAPIIIIENETDFEIYNGFEFIIETKELAQLSKDNLNYISILNGDYFKEIKENKKNKRIDKVLLQNIKDARSLLLKRGLSEHKNIANSLIGRIIFIRYLIDRKVYLEKYKKILTTEDDLKPFLDSKEKTYELFEYLKSDDGFNGDWFPILENEDEVVNETHLKILKELISGTKMSTGQRSLFDIYDFSIIPIEFISNVYESFIGENEQRKNGAYYTPTFLVDYILKYTVDDFFKNNPDTYNCKVLDPACGSGIFLVETLRKLVTQFEKIKKRPINKEELIQLVQDNIFGIDKDKDAVSISIFSLYLAMLDYQTPKELGEFKFPNLLKSEKNPNIVPNFFNDDFFNIDAEFNKILKEKEINFIIGNPPYGRGTVKKSEDAILYIRNENLDIGNEDIVQPFMIRVKDFSKKSTKISFIVTSKVLYNIQTQNFRKYNFFNKFKINHILELSSVRKEIFPNVKVPISIFFYEFSTNEEIEKNVVKYISMKPTPYFKKLKTLILTKQDFKKIMQIKLLENDYLWRIIVYGSYLDFNLIKKLKTHKSIHDISIDSNYPIGMGIQATKGKYNISNHLGKSFIEIPLGKYSEKYMSNFYIAKNLPKWDIEYVHRKGQPKLFNKYSVLIRRGVNTKTLKAKAAILYKEAVFKHTLTGVNVNDENIAKTFLGIINSSLFAYYNLQQASSIGIEREQLHDEEKLHAPYIKNKEIPGIVTKIEKLKKEFYDSTEIKSPYEFEKKLNQLIKELDNTILESFNLTNQEYSLIDYANTIVIPWVIQKKYDIPFKKLKFQDSLLDEYVNIFVNHYSKTYEQNNMYFQANILWDDYAIGIYFKVLNNKPNEAITWTKEKNIQKFLKISGNHTLENLFLQKDIKGFEEDGFYVIKPNEYKNWHKAIGYLDFYEFQDAILRAGRKGN